MFKNKKYHNYFSIWLIGLITLVAFIIVIGGLTRLTDSGLSITKWEVFKGILPPLNQESWERYFLEYKSIPQYVLFKPKYVYYKNSKLSFFGNTFIEYLGRIIGLFFFIPFIFFIFKRILNNYLTHRLILVSLLILLQGFIGWYMVKSGLVDNVSVSHYRLSLHLFTAFIIFSSLIWLFMNSSF